MRSDLADDVFIGDKDGRDLLAAVSDLDRDATGLRIGSIFGVEDEAAFVGARGVTPSAVVGSKGAGTAVSHGLEVLRRKPEVEVVVL